MGLNMFNNFFKDKTVLVTGHTGFKGSWLSIWLNELGANVIGYALDPYTDRDNFVLTGLSHKLEDIRADIRDFKTLDSIFEKYQPKIVFHLAAQPLVRESYSNPRETYETNVMGTINVLEAARNSKSVEVLINVTSDKCYENNEWIWPYRENDRLGGKDPYSSSKACSELVTQAYRDSFFSGKDKVAVATVRAGNVIGGGDWAKDRLVPDCIRALEEKRSINIRNPQSVRPWQHVLEPLSGYLLLAYKMNKKPNFFSQSWNFGPNPTTLITVNDLANKLIDYYGEGNLILKQTKTNLTEAHLLMLDISKSNFNLGWQPSLSINEAIKLTVEWYKKYSKNTDIYKLCKKQIKFYQNIQSNNYE
jgi:CDP-glucose 4,6-dehydratase